MVDQLVVTATAKKKKKKKSEIRNAMNDSIESARTGRTSQSH